MVFEPADEYKGDFARAYMYLFTVYKGLMWEYDDSDRNYMFVDNALSLRPWAQDLLLEWARQDPVSQKEIDRNEAVYKIQDNRNPFIDYPELAEHIWGIKSNEPFHIEDGDTPDPNPNPDPQPSEGEWDKPMSILQVIAGSERSGVWVTGYIVGWIDTGISNVYTEETATFTTPCTVASNMLMADNPQERDIAKCIPVQLVSGTDARKALNLVDNPGNLDKVITVKGDCQRYFGVEGLRSISNFNFDTIGVPDKPGLPSIYVANKTDGFDKWNFTDNAVGGGNVWKVDPKYGLVASGYISGSRYDTDTWAVSPEINLADYIKVELSFREAANYFNNNETFQKYCGVAVRETGGQWQMLTMPGMKGLPGNSWTFMDAGTVDISSYAGKKIEIGFHYTSSKAANLAGTWEIDGVRVAGEKKDSGIGAVELPKLDFDASTPGQLSIYNPGEHSYYIYDTAGCLVMSGTLHGETTLTLPRGLYIIATDGTRPAKALVR